MKPKQFWFLTLFSGLITAGILLAAYGIVYWVDSEPTQGYQDYKAAAGRYDAWYGSRNLDPRQVRFDEVLAGRAPSDSLDPSLRLLADDVRALTLAQGDVNGRAKIVRSLFIDQGGIGTRPWISCKQYDRSTWHIDACQMQPAAASLGNPERLMALLGSDEVAKSAALPIVPEEFRQRPVWNGGAETHRPLLERANVLAPIWRWSLAWLLVSTLFSAFFFLRGNHLHRRGGTSKDGWDSGPKHPEHPNPYGAVPHFLLGWVVYLAMLPGVLVMHALRIITSDAQPALKRTVNALRRRTFDSEHERTLAHLVEIRDKAAAHEHSEDIIKMIDRAVAKVKETKNLEELDKFRLVARDIECAYEAQIELRETLST